MKIGAHVSSSGSIEQAAFRASEIGAECFQIFLSAPMQWAISKFEIEKIEKFKATAVEKRLGPNFVHATYLLNLASDNPENLTKSIDWLILALNESAKLRLQGVIVHTGSHKGAGFDAVKQRVVDAISKILAEVPESVELILENTAGQKGAIGSFSDLGELIRTVDDPRLKVCLDTCHAFAAGYDLTKSEEVIRLISDFDQQIGLEKLAVIHANDSKFECGKFRDRHENIGQGFIGLDGFKKIMSRPELQDIPFILEVPGFEDKGPDKQNIDLLKSLRS